MSARPVRVTTDLDPDLFDGFRDWAHVNRVHQTKALRALVSILIDDPNVADRALLLARAYAEAERSSHRPSERQGA